MTDSCQSQVLLTFSTPFLLSTSKYTCRASTGNLGRFHCLRKSAWVVSHQTQITTQPGLEDCPMVDYLLIFPI